MNIPILDKSIRNHERIKFRVKEWADSNQLGDPVGGFLFRIHSERYQ